MVTRSTDTPQSLRDGQLLPCFRGGAAGGGVFDRGAIHVPRGSRLASVVKTEM